MAKPWKVRGLEPQLAFREAAKKIIATKYAEVASYQEEAMAGEDEEAVHNMRIAAKRLREALNIVRDGLPGKRVRRVREDANQLNDALGSVRDYDVLLEWLDSVLPEASPDEAAAIMVLAPMLQHEREERLAELRTVLRDLVPVRMREDLENLVGDRRIQEAMDRHG